MRFQTASCGRLAALFIPTALALAACGGGGASDSSGGGTTSPSTALTLTGTAATGAAIAGKAVEAKCSGGNGCATSGADGSFAITIAGGATLPCLLRVTAADGTVLHSAAAGSGLTAKANLTPVSELVLARVAAGAPASYFGSFDATAAAALSSARLQAAVSAVVDTLKQAGVDFSTVGDVLTGTLVPTNGAMAGNAMDQALDALKARLTSSGTTLAMLIDTVARSAPDAPPTALNPVASLPADMLLKPAASNCSALRSGRYRLVANDDPNTVPGGTNTATEVVTIDATTLTVTNSDNEDATLTAAGTCRYTVPNGGGMSVTPAGVVIAQIDAAPRRGAVLFPKQSHAVAELAGEWNAISLDRTADNAPIHLTTMTATIDASGKLTSGQHCDAAVSACQTLSGSNVSDISIKLNTAGGFDFVNATDRYTDRLFAYRAGGGEMMFVVLSPGGHITFATRKVARTLPAIGDLSLGWQIALVANLQAPFYTSPAAISQFRSTVTSLDAAAGRYERSAVLDFTSNATRPETLAINSPRDGYLRRLPGTVTASNGSTSTLSEWAGLPLRGMGMTAAGILGNNQLVLSASQAQ